MQLFQSVHYFVLKYNMLQQIKIWYVLSLVEILQLKMLLHNSSAI